MNGTISLRIGRILSRQAHLYKLASLDLGCSFYIRIKTKYGIQPADVKSLEHRSRRAVHAHFASRGCNLVIAGNEAANTGAVDFGNAAHVENNQALALAQ